MNIYVMQNALLQSDAHDSNPVVDDDIKITKRNEIN
jgi:hypothetical protein